FIILKERLPIGGLLEQDGVAVWSDRELYGYSLTRSARSEKKKKIISYKKLTEFKIGDLVVHSDHGIGILKFFTSREVEGCIKDYFVVGYSGNDLLYVPVEQLNKLSKYIGSKLVKLSRLGGHTWHKKKRRAKKQVEMMAKELLKIYARRKMVRRQPYGYSEELMSSIAGDFGYNLTDDQQLAWEDINSDLDMDCPMDRLLCGDVGFGKTELAIRAAARVALAGKQVAILAPTTVLAEQHLATFRERLNKYKIKVDVLSRLRDNSYQNMVMEELFDGKISILIGTHRILQKDVIFKDLGLLIIDEEQKFGVRAKERLKKIRNSIDVLSMSATPIPRTLNMSMGGVRDLSILETAPIGRQTIDTQIIPYSDSIIIDAVNKEMSRGGQIFIVHNRVRTIDSLKDHLSEILDKKVKIGVAHGQMSEKDLVWTMNTFAKGAYDVLLATTIVENGLDLPNVNTLVVENAAGLGLAQLYQLRGRVGRSDTKAYAYFLYRSEKLKDKAKQRLQAISEATELGSGMKLAVADMEIRGVGNVLGVQQHGNAYAVGLGVFIDMLGDTVEQLKGRGETEAIDDEQVIIDLPISFEMPAHYVPKKDERIYWEQRLSAQVNMADVDRVVLDMQRAYGVAPKNVMNLVNMIKLRIASAVNGIGQILFKRYGLDAGMQKEYLVLIFNNNVSLEWVKYLFMQADGWVFKNKEARIAIDLIGSRNWFGWLCEVMEGKK
ncbi:DEAD/DEAH box helicase, partial [Patescibacteria group bacterium]|nr:DEAD/DEAH box helicase [Patescibacteria group bacterium]